VWVAGAAGLLFLVIKKTIGLRVTPEEELAGLDVEEHGTPGYGADLLAGVGMPAAAITAHDHVPSTTG
jgi:ammonia channel protein AmtB